MIERSALDFAHSTSSAVCARLIPNGRHMDPRIRPAVARHLGWYVCADPRDGAVFNMGRAATGSAS